jgi:hypothetical protein
VESINNKVNEKLKSFQSRKSIIKIQRDGINDNPLYGFILQFNDRFVLLAQEYDFYMDGWMILERRFITKIEYPRSSRFHKSMLERESLLTNINPNLTVNLNNYRAIFRSLKKSKVFVIVENERPKEDKFLIGPIQRINKNNVSIRYFDVCGKWEKRYRKIDFDEITSIRFGCNYIKLYEKYLKK